MNKYIFFQLQLTLFFHTKVFVTLKLTLCQYHYEDLILNIKNIKFAYNYTVRCPFY